MIYIGHSEEGSQFVGSHPCGQAHYCCRSCDDSFLVAAVSGAVRPTQSLTSAIFRGSDVDGSDAGRERASGELT